MPLLYDKGQKEYQNWILSETIFRKQYLAKCESLFCLGNGYMGIRGAIEESYAGETRDLFVAGTFNKFSEREVSELPNAADITMLKITLNGVLFSLSNGRIIDNVRELNLKDGELTRSILWESRKREKYHILYRRFISMKNLHLIGVQLSITPYNNDAEVSILSGICGQVTNSGTQNFIEGPKRFHENKYLELVQTTTESDIDFVFGCSNRLRTSKDSYEQSELRFERRKIHQILTTRVRKKKTLFFEKKVIVHTSRDKKYTSLDPNYNGKYSSKSKRDEVLEKIREDVLNEIKETEPKGYCALLEESINEWKNIWDKIDIQIDTTSNFDQIALRFAMYHLMIMAPAHDNRFGIAAKGLTGEGYKGHSFWDSEIFIAPFFMYTKPETARSLLEYRYNLLNSARLKAKKYGYKGAMYPWESAWINDGESAPVKGPVNLETGEPSKLITGRKEHHITADIAYAVWQYFMITNDQDFMNKYGYEILFETATFWASRLEWSKDRNLYVINDIIGPDEYKQQVDNNAFTNYLASWNIKKAIELYNTLKQKNNTLFTSLSSTLELDEKHKTWIDKTDKIYLPVGLKDSCLIPQDDTYLKKKRIDLTPYKKQEEIGVIFKEFSFNEVNKLQISKQADIIMLFYLLENLFCSGTKKANLEYYEPLTLHDSSLSLSIYSIIAGDIGETELAYELFNKASRIDLGTNLKSSDDGIHAGSMGGLWQSVICGFGGVRMVDGNLLIRPKLPKKWFKMEFIINWHGDSLKFLITNLKISIHNMTKNNSKIELTVLEKQYIMTDKLDVFF